MSEIYPYLVIGLMLLTYMYSFWKKINTLRDMNGAVLALLVYIIGEQFWWLSLIVLVTAYFFAILQAKR
ncbi:hypothetical protein NDK47_26410 [Brevibacillus ruminantium]|uniref:Uncharacterized protein n=1 Tax=Brevibacillus ruminantium TaxID=2950604 RepID=A0ABY4WLS2_9BACL|nr:hypothetical protein [Brevibacillus ruminantium]USG65591.1 hypothetical protein NDK47_26410 [Brevibacillus ruminantium]